MQYEQKEYSKITQSIEDITKDSQIQLLNDLSNYKLIDEDIKSFLKLFFRKNIGYSLFINQIVNLGQEYVTDFQNYTYIKIIDYFKQSLGVDGLEFYFNSEILGSYIQVSICDLELCLIDIYNKKLIIFEEYYFKDINEKVDELLSKKEILIKEYDKYENYSLNTFTAFKESNDLNMIQSADMLLSSMNLKKNKYKKKYANECIEINQKILDIDSQISEYIETKSILEKNLMNIRYYQTRISDRLYRNLNYKIEKN